jgi:hypothetical protein
MIILVLEKTVNENSLSTNYFVLIGQLWSIECENRTWKFYDLKTRFAFIITLQSQEILNRPVFVLEILKKSEQSLNILNIVWKIWTDSEHCEYCLKNLIRFWTFWLLSEKSEQKKK